MNYKSDKKYIYFSLHSLNIPASKIQVNAMETKGMD